LNVRPLHVLLAALPFTQNPLSLHKVQNSN